MLLTTIFIYFALIRGCPERYVWKNVDFTYPTPSPSPTDEGVKGGIIEILR
jgi:hypothetical protein